MKEVGKVETKFRYRSTYKDLSTISNDNVTLYYEKNSELVIRTW